MNGVEWVVGVKVGDEVGGYRGGGTRRSVKGFFARRECI